MKKELLSLNAFAFLSLLAIAPAAKAQVGADFERPILCTHENDSIEVQMITEQKIELIFADGATASLNFYKQVQPNGQVFFQYKGKTSGLDCKSTTAYLSPDHSTLLLPHSDEPTGTYIQYSCQELVENQ